MSIPTDRLREIAEIVRQGCTVGYDYNEVLAMATELLACREERDAAQERVDLDIDEFRRIKAELSDLRVGLPPLTEGSARSLYAVVAGICDRAVTSGRQRVPLIVQRDKAEEERDAARAEAEKLRLDLSIAEGNRDGYRDELGEHIEDRDRLALDGIVQTGETLAAAVLRFRTELAAVKRQRDEAIEKMRELLEWARRHAQWPERWAFDQLGVWRIVASEIRSAIKMLALAAEQPKPQQPEAQT